MRQITLNRQKLGLEDLSFGVGTEEQVRAGIIVTINKINAGNLPFDETRTLLEWAQDANIEALGAIVNKLSAIGDNLTKINATFDNLVGINSIVSNLSELLLVNDNAAQVSSDKVTVANDKAIVLGYKDAVNTMKLAVESIYDAFDDRFLGVKSSDPTLDNDGNTLIDGALYFNSSSHALKVYSSSTLIWYSIPQIYLSGLLDVTLTSITTGDILTWNGSKWINTRTPSFDSIKLNGGTGTNGTTTWNNTEYTYDIVLNPNVTLQVGQEDLVYCKNNSVSVIANGRPVMASGTNGNSGNILVDLHDGTKANAIRIVGIATEDLTANGYGFVTRNGKVRGIDTTGSQYGETWVNGDILYVKATGNLTKVEPLDSQLKMPIAFVIHAHTHGTLYVRTTGIDENHDRDLINTKLNTSDVLGSFGMLSSPLLDLPLKNSLTMKAGVGSTTFTRASTATYIDRYGVLKTAGIDVPRFEKEGYLNEGSSTNLILNSETLTNQSVTVISGTTYTISFYGTGVVTLGGAFSSSINGLGLFPTRTKLTFVATSTILTISVNGEAKLAQLEALLFASSYIPTTTSTVTRSADVLQVTRENNFPNAENNEKGYSVAFTYDSLGRSTTQYLWSLRIDGQNYVQGYLLFINNSLGNYIAKDGVSVSNSVTPVTLLGSNKVVQTQSNTFLKQYINGTLANTDVNTLGALGGGVNSLTNIFVGGCIGLTAYNLFGHISDFKVYDRELTPVEVALL